jgi:hypothetical protein
MVIAELDAEVVCAAAVGGDATFGVELPEAQLVRPAMSKSTPTSRDPYDENTATSRQLAIAELF